MSKTVLTKTPRCPVEIYRIAEQEGFAGDLKKGRAERSEYIKQQLKISENMEKSGYGKQQLPPCCDCHELVFMYCEQSGMECKIFQMYVSSGKVPKHRCVERMERVRKANPDLERYCENPRDVSR